MQTPLLGFLVVCESVEQQVIQQAVPDVDGSWHGIMETFHVQSAKLLYARPG